MKTSIKTLRPKTNTRTFWMITCSYHNTLVFLHHAPKNGTTTRQKYHSRPGDLVRNRSVSAVTMHHENTQKLSTAYSTTKLRRVAWRTMLNLLSGASNPARRRRTSKTDSHAGCLPSPRQALRATNPDDSAVVHQMVFR